MNYAPALNFTIFNYMEVIHVLVDVSLLKIKSYQMNSSVSLYNDTVIFF